MASKADSWRRRILQGLEQSPQLADPGQGGMLAGVIGEPSPELVARLAEPGRDAAVLIGLIERSAGLTVLLTERARHLQHHPGQVSFPGGRLDPSEDPVTAALREAHEEVGLVRPQVEVLGSLTPQVTGTGFNVTPVVGWVAADFEARPDPSEVESVFEVPLEHLLDPRSRQRGTRERWGTRFVSYEFRYGRYRIWGATAAILVRFIEVINAEKPKG